MPLVRRGRPLKRWRYLGFYGPELMLCAGDVRVGPLRQQFWAVAERGQPLRERTALGSAGVAFDGARLTVESGGVHVDVTAGEGGGIETVHPSGRHGYVWTRKRAGVPMRGALTLDGRTVELDGEGATDETAGYHQRRTSWRWSAGIGRAEGGERVAWNLVEGVNDAASGSERAVWVEGEPSEPAPVRFAADLSAIELSDGGRLEFEAWPDGTREERTNVLVLRSDYRQPFGTFSGRLPGGLRLAWGLGVMETHSAVW
jgi:Protein of unknown function (DUF2804)